MFTDNQIRQALINEWEFLIHDCAEEGDMTVEEFTEHVANLNRQQLIDEACVDEQFTLEEFIESYGE